MPIPAKLVKQGVTDMLAFASILGVSDYWYDGDLSANLASVKRGLKVADEYGYPMYRVIGPLWATAALAARGPAPEVLEQLCGLLGKLPAENRCIQMPLYRILLATEFGRIGQMERARSFAASAESLVKKTGERWAAPEIYRIHGSLLCREPLRDDRAAMWWLRRAEAAARKAGESYDRNSEVSPTIDETVRMQASAAGDFDPAEFQHGKHSASYPPFAIAVLPLVVVICTNLLMSLVVLPRLDFSFLAKEVWGETTIGAVAGVWSVVIALATATLTVIVLNFRRFPALRESLDAGAASSVMCGSVIKRCLRAGAAGRKRECRRTEKRGEITQDA